jgi:hypothetical protein
LRLEQLEDRTVPSASLSVSLSAPATAIAASRMTLTLTITNTGIDDSTGVQLNCSGATVVSQTQVSGPAFTLGITSGAAHDTIATLAHGASAVFHVLAVVPTGLGNGEELITHADASDDDMSNPTDDASTAVYTFTYGPIDFVDGNPGTQSNVEGDAVSLSITAMEGNSATFHYTAAGLPPGLAIGPTSGTIAGTVAVGAAALGPYTTTVMASDGTWSRSETFTWNVSSPVSLTNPGTRSNAEGDTVSLSLSASDSSGGTLHFAAVGLPDGLKINTSTGAITGTVAAGDAELGPFSVTVTAGDNTYSTSQTFTWNVSGPVTMVEPPDQTSTEGDSISLAISAHESGSGTLVFGAAGLPPGLHISTSTGSISGTVAAGDADLGPYSVTVTAGDGTSSASRSFTWFVTNPIAIVTPADQTSSEGASVSLAVSASDSSSGTRVYGAVGLPGGLSISSSTGTISGTVAAGAAAHGPYTVTVLAEDGTYRNLTSFTWAVNGPIAITTPADQSNQAGDSVSLAVSASYSGSGSLTYSAAGLPNGLSINSSTGVISGTLSAGGSFSPTVTATHSTDSASVSFAWSVGSPITITDAGNQSFHAGDAVSVPIHATDTASGTLSYSASGLLSGLSINSTSGLISGTIGAVSAGIYTTTVTVTDGTHTAVDTFTWTVYPAGAVVISNPGDRSSAEGASVSLSLSSSYSGSGTVKYAALGLPPGLSLNPSTGVISGTVAGASLFGPYVSVVTATDGTDSDSQWFTWTVTGPLTLTNPGDQTGTEGSSVSLSLSASYSGGGITYSALGLPAGLSLNSSTGAISGTLAAGDAALGPYTVTVQAASGSYSAEQTFAWTISSPIAITTPASQTSSEGDTVSLSISATDSTSGTLRYAAAGLPPGLKINTSTGAITGTVGAARPGRTS